MPYATNDAVRLYYETVGTGPPLLLHTGFGGVVETWAEFGVSHFRLIPLLRNHAPRPDHCCRAGLQAYRRLGLWAGCWVGVTA